MKNIAITTGDTDGVGLEVTLKALNKIKLPSTTHYFIYKSKNTPKFLLPKIRLLLKKYPQQIHFFERHDSPAKWVFEAACMTRDKKYAALVTGPLSKTEITRAGYSYIGHTEMLKKIAHVNTTYMLFLGKYFNVLLLTGHLPLKNVTRSLQSAKLITALKLAHHFCSRLPDAKKNRPLALLGLNPHSGEGGLIGNEEKRLFLPTVKKMAKMNINVTQPLVPDAAFLKKNWKKFSIFVCPYHDQGLIPFKLVHGASGAHVSLGLPFIRTSVDHGTAKDIFGKNLADCSSMLDAIRWANILSKGVVFNGIQ